MSLFILLIRQKVDLAVAPHTAAAWEPKTRIQASLKSPNPNFPLIIGFHLAVFTVVYIDLSFIFRNFALWKFLLTNSTVPTSLKLSKI